MNVTVKNNPYCQAFASFLKQSAGIKSHVCDHVALSPFLYKPHHCLALPALPLLAVLCSNMDYWIYWGQTRLQWVAMAGWGNGHWLLLAIAESMLSLMAILVVCSRQLVRSTGQADNEVWSKCGVQQSIPNCPIPSGTVFSLQSLCSNCHSIDQLTSPATSKFSLQIVQRIWIHSASLIFRPPNSTEHCGTELRNRAK